MIPLRDINPTRTFPLITILIIVANAAVYATDGSNHLTAYAVGQSQTTTTLTSSANPAPVGANVTFTANVTGNAPTGSVAFTDGSSSISGCSATPLAGSGNTRTASCSTSSLAAGTQGARRAQAVKRPWG